MQHTSKSAIERVILSCPFRANSSTFLAASLRHDPVHILLRYISAWNMDNSRPHLFSLQCSGRSPAAKARTTICAHDHTRSTCPQILCSLDNSINTILAVDPENHHTRCTPGKQAPANSCQSNVPLCDLRDLSARTSTPHGQASPSWTCRTFQKVP